MLNRICNWISSDRKILRELQRDAKQSNAALAASVGLSESACLRRVRLLEQAGVIERYTAMLSPPKVGVTVGFIIRITLQAARPIATLPRSSRRCRRWRKSPSAT
jgi:DNA-binding Lrp family transcriptional regulator